MHRPVDRQSSAPWFVLAAILATGALAAWLIVFMIGTTIVSTFARSRSTSNQLVFTVEGEPLLQTYSYDGLRNVNEYTYRTLDGRKIDEPDKLHLSEESNARELPATPPDRYSSNNWLWRLHALLQTRPELVAWYLVHDGRKDGNFWIVGYQPQSKQLVGYLGRKGFRSEMPPQDELFSLPLSTFNTSGVAPMLGMTSAVPTSRFGFPALYLISHDALYKIDFARQTVEPVAMQDKVVAVGTYSELTPVSDERHATYKDRLLVRLPKELHVLSMEGDPLRIIPLTKPMQSANLALIGTTTDELIVLTRGKDYYSPRELYWIGPQGEVKRDAHVSLFHGPGGSGGSAWVVCSVMPTPLVLSSFSFVAAALSERTDESPTFATAYAEVVSQFWLPFLVVSLVSAALAVLVYRRHRALSSRGALAWAIFVFLLGLPGLIGYWTHRRWPATARCEHCGATVPRDRVTCLACATEFPQPAIRGIEIFA